MPPCEPIVAAALAASAKSIKASSGLFGKVQEANVVWACYPKSGVHKSNTKAKKAFAKQGNVLLFAFLAVFLVFISKSNAHFLSKRSVLKLLTGCD